MPTEITRDDVHFFLQEVSNDLRRGDQEASHEEAKARIVEHFPDLAGKTIRRNGKVYDAVDYLMDDLGSYGH